MKTKNLTIDIKAIKANYALLEDVGLAKKLLAANFFTLRDFQDFLSSVPSPLNEENFEEHQQNLIAQIDAIYSAIRGARDSEGLAGYKPDRRDDFSNTKAKLKVIRSTLDTFGTFKKWYDDYHAELSRQSGRDIRSESQLDNFVVHIGADKFKVGDYIKAIRLAPNGKDSHADDFTMIAGLLKAEPFSMHERDVDFVLGYVNQENFIANLSTALIGHGITTGGMFFSGKWGLAENREKRSINLYLDTDGRLGRIETLVGHRAIPNNRRSGGIEVDFIEEMQFSHGLINARRVTISSEKPFTVPVELINLPECLVYVREPGIMDKIKDVFSRAIKRLQAKMVGLRKKPLEREAVSAIDAKLLSTPTLSASRVQAGATSKGKSSPMAGPRGGAKTHPRVNTSGSPGQLGR